MMISMCMREGGRVHEWGGGGGGRAKFSTNFTPAPHAAPVAVAVAVHLHPHRPLGVKGGEVEVTKSKCTSSWE